MINKLGVRITALLMAFCLPISGAQGVLETSTYSSRIGKTHPALFQTQAIDASLVWIMLPLAKVPAPTIKRWAAIASRGGSAAIQGMIEAIHDYLHAMRYRMEELRPLSQNRSEAEAQILLEDIVLTYLEMQYLSDHFDSRTQDRYLAYLSGAPGLGPEEAARYAKLVYQFQSKEFRAQAPEIQMNAVLLYIGKTGESSLTPSDASALLWQVTGLVSAASKTKNKVYPAADSKAIGRFLKIVDGAMQRSSARSKEKEPIEVILHSQGYDLFLRATPTEPGKPRAVSAVLHYGERMVWAVHVLWRGPHSEVSDGLPLGFIQTMKPPHPHKFYSPFVLPSEVGHALSHIKRRFEATYGIDYALNMSPLTAESPLIRLSDFSYQLSRAALSNTGDSPQRWLEQATAKCAISSVDGKRLLEALDKRGGWIAKSFSPAKLLAEPRSPRPPTRSPLPPAVPARIAERIILELMGTTFQTLSPAEALHRLFSGAVVGRMQVAPEAIDSRLHLPTGTAAYVSTQPNPRRNEKFTAETLRQMTAYCRTLFAEFENELGATGVAEILPFAIPDSISSPAVTRMTAKGLALFFAHTINGDDLQPELLKLLRKRVLDPEKGLRSEFQLFVDGIPRRGAESLNLGTPFRKIATIGPFTANPSMEALLRIAESNRPEKSAAAQIKTVTPPAAEKRDKPKQERLSLGKDEHYLLANLRNMQAQRMLKSGVNKFYVRLIEKMRTLREAPIQTVEDLRERMMTLPYWLAGREDIITRQLTVELIAHLRLKFVLPVRAASKASA